MSAAAENAVSQQWQKDGADIEGATSTSYSKASVALEDAGSYTVVFKGKEGDSATTNPAVITVTDGETPVEQVAIQGARKRAVKKGQAIEVDVTVSPESADQSITVETGDSSIATAKVA